METIDLCIVRSLDGSDVALLPYIPYLLQDIWEIGSSADHLCRLIEKNDLTHRIKKGLDLGCGKGAISITMAKRFGWTMHGIDAMSDFIDEAKQRAETLKINSRVSFEVADLRLRLRTLGEYDLIILGSIGPVLGTIQETLSAVRPSLNQPGYVLLDDGYAKEDEASYDVYPYHAQVLEQIEKAGFILIDEYIYDYSTIRESNEYIYKAIEKRAGELSEQFPAKQHLFQDYLDIQRRENRVLEEEIVCATWLLSYQ